MYGYNELLEVYNKQLAIRNALNSRPLDVSAFATMSISPSIYVINQNDSTWANKLKSRYERWEQTYKDYYEAWQRGSYTWEDVERVGIRRDIAKQDYERSTTNTNLFRKLETNMFVLNDWAYNTINVEPLDWVDPNDRLAWNKTPTIERINMWNEYAQNYGQELGLW